MRGAKLQALLWSLLGLAVFVETVAGTETAFFYGTPLPVDLLERYPRVVLEPENVSQGGLERLGHAGVKRFAYLSIGEVGSTRSWRLEIDDEWILGQNAAWKSAILDLDSVGWRGFLLERAKKLHEQGFDGLFLDTLDSFQLAARTPAARKKQEDGLVLLIETLRAELPGLDLLFNRGFEVLPRVREHVAGVVAESLLRSWEPSNRRYVEVKPESKRWLLGKLRWVRDTLEIPVNVIDYVGPRDRRLAIETARSIRELGFTPWVAQPGLDDLGVSFRSPVPRRVLVIWDSQRGSLYESLGHSGIAALLEHYGYAVDYVDLAGDFGPDLLTARHAGIVVWSSGGLNKEPQRFRAWLGRQMDRGLRVAFFGPLEFALDGEFLDRLGISGGSRDLEPPLRITRRDGLIGFESKPRVRNRSVPVWESRSPENQVHLRVEGSGGGVFDAVVTGPWGGVARSPFVTKMRPDNTRRWIIDPFAFLERALGIGSIPAGDVTTELGRRYLMVHIDGDGSPSRAEFGRSKFSNRVVQDEILSVYRVPTTVSFIEGEISSTGLYPPLAEELEQTAREIFALPHVEVASHTYSHPFNWLLAEHEPAIAGHRLDVPGYKFDLEREIVGSMDYVSGLAPEEKDARVLLWSGTALPSERAIALAEAQGFHHINGGATKISEDLKTLLSVSPMARPVGKQLQVYAPIMNENVFTNDWTGPFYGFRRVIETMKLTDLPRRLKPLGIYYHFYSGSKIASLVALKEVYDWALEQESFPLWVSEFCPKVKSFYDFGLEESLEGEWVVLRPGALRTFRVSESLGYPDVTAPGVVGFRDLPQGRYVAIDPSRGEVLLRFRTEAPSVPWVVQSNAALSDFRRGPKSIRFRLERHLPLVLEIARAGRQLALRWNGEEVVGRELTGDRALYEVLGTEDGEVRIDHD